MSTLSALRRTTSAALVILLGALLAACSDPEPEASEPPPTLEAEWTIPGFNANPQVKGAHHWITYQSTTSGVGWGTQNFPGSTLLVDARTGAATTRAIHTDHFPCVLPSTLSDSGLLAMMWPRAAATDPDEEQPADACSRITVHDVSTGDLVWKRGNVDLAPLGGLRALGADDDVVAIVNPDGDHLCFAAADGDDVDSDDAVCRTLVDRLTHADLPPLTSLSGDDVPLDFLGRWDGVTRAEIGRTDDVLLVRDVEDAATPVVRAHDLETGETLWRDELELDPRTGGPWTRNEAWLVAPSGVARVSYQYVDDDSDVHRTPMVVTAVDPRSGKDLRPVARLEGAWFNHQFGDVTVALTQQELALNSTLSGFTLPTW